MMSDISEDGLKILFINNYGAIYLVNLESMDTTIVDFGEGSGSHEARFTYDENVIVYLDRYTIGYDSFEQLYKHSFIDNSETLIDTLLNRSFDNITMSPDKQRSAYFKEDQDGVHVVIVDFQNGQTSTLVTLPIMSNLPELMMKLSYWGQDDYIYLTLMDSNNIPQLFRIHSSNGSLTQLTENYNYLLASNDTHLEKLAFVNVDTVSEYWIYDFESNETSYLDDIDGGSWPTHQTWSPDRSTIAINEALVFPAPGFLFPGYINIFDTVTGSVTTLVDSTWQPCFWVGSSSGTVDIQVSYNEGWNLVGLPLEVEDASYNILFPESIDGTLYSFSEGYILDSTLVHGEGYWLRFNNAGSTTIDGTPINELTIGLNEGWNLISGISTSINISDIQDPDGIIIAGTVYGFALGGYSNAEILEPGKGYWVRANSSGNIILITE